MKNLFILLVSFLTLTSGYFSLEIINDQAFRSPSSLENNRQKTFQKIGILFGTFDPPHLGHKSLALAMKNKFGLDVVFFIPRDKEDYKPNKQSIQVRNKLVELMLADTPSMKLIPPLVAANVKGLRSEEAFKALRESYPKDQISLILGDDTLNSLSMNQVQIPEGFQLLVTRRAGNEALDLPTTLDGSPVHIMKVSDESSSTSIRQILKEGGVPEMLPEDVYRYIKEHQLYATAPPLGHRMPPQSSCMSLFQELALP